LLIWLWVAIHSWVDGSLFEVGREDEMYFEAMKMVDEEGETTTNQQSPQIINLGDLAGLLF